MLSVLAGMSGEHVATPGGLKQKPTAYKELQQLDLIFLPIVQSKRWLAFSYISADVSVPPEETGYRRSLFYPFIKALGAFRCSRHKQK